jgi:hypothetical protein
MRLSSGEDGHRAPQDISEWEAVGRINAVLDRVRSSAPGPGLEEVERLLAKEWLAEFGLDIPQESLVAFAPALAEGYMFRVRPAPYGLTSRSPAGNLAGYDHRP